MYVSSNVSAESAELRARRNFHSYPITRASARRPSPGREEMILAL